MYSDKGGAEVVSEGESVDVPGPGEKENKLEYEERDLGVQG